MTPDTLVIDIQFKGVGRINRRTGTLDKKVVRGMKRAAREAYRAGKLDVLRALRDRHISWLEFYEAVQRNTVDALPVGGTVAKLETTMRVWINSAKAKYSDKHATSLGTSLNYFVAAKKDATVADLPAILDKLRGTLGDEHPRSFNLARSAAMRFIRATLKRSHQLYLACAAVEKVPEPKKGPRHPITFARMREFFPDPKNDALDKIAWTMATTGMHAKEYWGEWRVESDHIHVGGTKTKGRVRDIPLVRVPDRPPLSRDRFEKVFRERFQRVVTPYQLRRTYAQWMEEAGIPRTRRKLYMGHGSDDVTDLYERYQIEEFLAADAKRFKAFLAPKRAKKQRSSRESPRLVVSGGKR